MTNFVQEMEAKLIEARQRTFKGNLEHDSRTNHLKERGYDKAKRGSSARSHNWWVKE